MLSFIGYVLSVIIALFIGVCVGAIVITKYAHDNGYVKKDPIDNKYKWIHLFIKKVNSD